LFFALQDVDRRDKPGDDDEEKYCPGILVGGALARLVSSCSQATPAWGPDTPSSGAGQPVDAAYGTPLPGFSAINEST